MFDDEAVNDAFQWSYTKYIGEDPYRLAAYENELRKLEIAQQIFDIRRKLGIMREQLADIAGLSRSVVRRLEDAIYDEPMDEPVRLINTALDIWVKEVILPASQVKIPDEPVKRVSNDA